MTLFISLFITLSYVKHITTIIARANFFLVEALRLI